MKPCFSRNMLACSKCKQPDNRLLIADDLLKEREFVQFRFFMATVEGATRFPENRLRGPSFAVFLSPDMMAQFTLESLGGGRHPPVPERNSDEVSDSNPPKEFRLSCHF
ncbi:hypothetical protein CDAR_98081 [Caerostris darwini]|uniref:Uncharacterized protein n=1 Tax=Caerostris darwini TaxID=1538125 RepID=A0AAV4UG37_9ARAC|nr:hypothetical protein CDAR_98081 [Caerostris darwini]